MATNQDWINSLTFGEDRSFFNGNNPSPTFSSMFNNNNPSPSFGVNQPNTEFSQQMQPEPTFSQQFFGYKDPATGQQMGGSGANWANLGMGGLKLGLGAYSTYLAKKQTDLAEDTLNFNKETWNKEYNNTVKLTNAELADRQRRRVAANPNAQSVDSYMKQYGL